MLKIPVFSTIGQAMAIFGTRTGRLLLWALLATVLCIGVGASFFLAGLAAKALLRIPESRQGVLAILAFPALVIILLCWIPFSIRINQLAVAGRVQRDGYLAMIFSGRSLLYLGYGVLVHAIMIAGWLLSCLPAILTIVLKAMGSQPFSPKAFSSAAEALFSAGDSTLILACLASLGLGILFTVLASPLQLVFPAASVEEHPSLARAYDLGSGNKLRLFWAMFLAAMLFAAISGVLDYAMKHFGADKSWQAGLILFPLNVLIGVFSTVTSTAVPAVAYRILSGLPDPEGEGVPAGQTRPEPKGLMSVIEPPSGAGAASDQPPRSPVAPEAAPIAAGEESARDGSPGAASASRTGPPDSQPGSAGGAGEASSPGERGGSSSLDENKDGPAGPA